MRNCIDIDHAHARAICLEIGERLRPYLREEPELPGSIRERIERLRQLDTNWSSNRQAIPSWSRGSGVGHGSLGGREGKADR